MHLHALMIWAAEQTLVCRDLVTVCNAAALRRQGIDLPDSG